MLMITFYRPADVLSYENGLCVVMVTNTLFRKMHYYSYFTNKETEADLGNMPRWQVMVSGFASRLQNLDEFLQSVVFGGKE